MSLWKCRVCTAAYAPGLPRCPQCQAEDPIKEDEQLEKEREEMAKTTVHNGVSNESAEPGQPGYVDPAATDETEGTADGTDGAGHDEVTEDGDQETEAVDYNAFTVDDLRAELRERNRDLSTVGNKPDLVARLIEDDAAQAADTEE